ncbi:MAG: hypothetical protein RSC04_05050 [Bacteroidales bacterium]
MRKQKILIAFFSVFSVWTSMLFAQTQDYNEKVLVMAPYQPNLGTVDKVNINPSYQDTSFDMQAIRYDVLSRPVAIVFPIENIKPAKVTGEPISRLFSNHIKLGMGTYITPLAEVYLNTGRSKNKAAGVSYKHLSSFADLKGYDSIPTNTYKNDINIYGQYFTDAFTLGLDLYYLNEKVNCYGFNNDREFPSMLQKLEPQRWYNDVGGKFSIQDNAIKEDALKYSADFRYNFNSTNWHTRESNFEINGAINASLISNTKYMQSLKIGGKLFFADYLLIEALDVPRTNYIQLRMEPTLDFTYSIFDLHAALRFNVYQEKEMKLMFSPVINVNVNVVKNVLSIYTGITGDVDRITMESTIKENPFLNPRISSQLGFTRDKFSYYLGLNASILKELDFSFRASTHSLANYYCFDSYRYTYGVYSTVAYADFQYKTMNVFLLKLNANLNYRLNDKITASLDATYNYYSKDIFYKPAFEAELTFRYNIKDKFIVKTQVVGYTNMKALDALNKPTIVKGAVDWSAGLEYLYSKRWSFFADFNNLIGQRYFTWYDYPSYRFNFMLGATFSF